MTRKTALLIAASGCVSLLAGACAVRKAPDAPPVPRDEVASYRGYVTQGESRRQFKALVHARLPDRIHVEVSGPLGRSMLILDAGGGRVAVALVRDRIAYVGEDTPRVYERLVGVPITSEALVRSLLTGELVEDAGVVVTRVPREAFGHPDSLEVARGGARLRLELRARRPIDPERILRLGTASPPSGFEVAPIEAFPAEASLSSALEEVE